MYALILIHNALIFRSIQINLNQRTFSVTVMQRLLNCDTRTTQLLREIMHFRFCLTNTMAFAGENCNFASSLPRLNPFILPNGAYVKKGFRFNGISYAGKQYYCLYIFLFRGNNWKCCIFTFGSGAAVFDEQGLTASGYKLLDWRRDSI